MSRRSTRLPHVIAADAAVVCHTEPEITGDDVDE